ncbi:MAG: ParB/RepB/Spo0J family partition protein [Novosphingobium sp.]|nr:ParB/RepB/Spo0J family partition protein [Novosphingobium sp.]
MELCNIEIACLSVSKANMRHCRKQPDISDILPSVKARGVLVPLLVRPAGEDGQFEIVAGRRRYHAALASAEGDETPPPLPCAILEAGDDAAALEASLIENVARQDPDEVTKWGTFKRLVKEGRSSDDIAETFGLSAIKVKRILALGNLLPAIRAAYRADDIDVVTIRHLTLATKAQQKSWLELFKDEEAYAPRGHQLKAWLFGGASIPTEAALFDISTYQGHVITDLFEDDGYFADADQFWIAQNAEIERRRAVYLEDGWSAVEIVPPERYFQTWEYVHVSKRNGGRVYVDVNGRGEVAFHEGYLTRKEVQRQAANGGSDEAPTTSARPEVTNPMNEYLDLHRHGAVRAGMATRPDLALRVATAHMICGSPLWQVRPFEPRLQRQAVVESIARSRAETALADRRRGVQALLGFECENACVVQAHDHMDGITGVVRKLLCLSDDDVLAILALVMAETLTPGTELVEALGLELATDMSAWWSADQAFIDLIRDREVLVAILSEVAGQAVAEAHSHEKTATLKRLIADCLEGTGDREKCENWVPRWLGFPPSAYTERGGVGTVTAHQRLGLSGSEEPVQPEQLHEAAE